jgi:hypothetical protein
VIHRKGERDPFAVVGCLVLGLLARRRKRGPSMTALIVERLKISIIDVLPFLSFFMDMKKVFAKKVAEVTTNTLHLKNAHFPLRHVY